MAQLGRYEILEQIGTGAMGNVYRARDTALDREVAVKTIRTGVDVDPEVRQRFYREARACARLQHSNIIAVFDLGEIENTAFIAMELLEGADFRRVIQERQAVPLRARIAAAVEVCDAIGHAHRHGVIHRDIKPSNLFLTNSGGAKVLDFGIARLPSSKLTVAGQILGTPNYMAPEQILAHPSDGRADLFSAAVVFFELFAYAHPFQGTLVPRRIVQSEPDSLFDYNAGLPLILEKVLARGLAKDPNQRYQTGDEFAKDLRAVLDALGGNASAGLANVALPSENVLPIESFPPVPPAAAEVPDDQDPQEWRLSEALRLLPEFEAVIERRDIAGAQAVVAELETRLAGDIRFMEAIRLCRSRLSGLMGESNSLDPTRLDQSALFAIVREPSERSLPAARTSGRAATAARVDLDATYFGSSSTATAFPPSQPTPPPSQEVSARRSTSAPLPVAPRPASSQPTPARQPDKQRRKVLAVAVGVLLLLILILMLGITAFTPVTLQPGAVATATVSVPSVNLLAAGDSAAKRIASLTRGTQLNVLRLPIARGQAWVNVQAVKPKVSAPGYVRVGALRDWQGKSSKDSLTLVRIFSSGESGNEDEINAEIKELTALASRFMGEPAANDALLDIAHLKLVLARRYESMGKPQTEWEPVLKAAQQQLEALRVDPNWQARVAALDQEINAELLTLQPPPPLRQRLAAPPPTLLNASELMVRARQLRQDGDYDHAERVLETILRALPRNKDAKELLNKIQQARDGEKE